MQSGAPAASGRRAGPKPPPGPRRSMATVVASGILLSRVAGLVRESIFAHYLGNSAAADAFKAGFRIPNILQNLFGEGVLSASFIPVYSRMLGEGDEEAANTLAWTVGVLMSLALSVLVLLGVLGAPYLIDVIAPGFQGPRRELCIMLVRILFPGAGMLAMSAWCLGVLNSHQRFFASYAAPVAWNLAIIAALVYFGPQRSQVALAVDLAWAAVVGAVLQFAVQVPQTLRLMRRLDVGLRRIAEPLKAVWRNLTPVIAGRGVVQLSGYIDNLLASLLPIGAVAALNYSQILYMLPLSLFGASVAAAELPEMSRQGGESPEVAAVLRSRLDSGLRHISFLVVPSAAAFLFLGGSIVTLIFQSGRFTHSDAIYVWSVLAGSAVGLLAVTMGRLYNSAYYALWDTRTPFKFATIRVALTLVLGYLAAIVLPPMIGIERRWGVAGLTVSAGIAGWVEFSLLRSRLNRRIGRTGVDRAYLVRLWIIAIMAAGVALALKYYVVGSRGRLEQAAVVFAYGVLYLTGAYWMGIPELRDLLARIRRPPSPSASD